MDVGQKGLAHHHGDVFIGRGCAYVRGAFGVGALSLLPHCLYG